MHVLAVDDILIHREVVLKHGGDGTLCCHFGADAIPRVACNSHLALFQKAAVAAASFHDVTSKHMMRTKLVLVLDVPSATSCEGAGGASLSRAKKATT